MSRDLVRDQYEVYPYPTRHPEDERKRMITGSPSLPVEMDHWLWGGERDWSKPLRVLVAGGGTGDGLIQLAQTMRAADKPYEITYVDLSTHAREIAEARARMRGLTGITFHTGSLLDASELGVFDYIDCCGVLHHLPEPQAGFDALAAALAPGGGIGLMVYAPLGRSGVYPLQEAFSLLSREAPPAERLAMAKAIFERLPASHPFKRNPHLVDHNQGDAGFYDLLLHTSDRAYTISELDDTLAAAGLEVASPAEPLLYDPRALMPDGAKLPATLSRIEQMQLAENLRGTFKTHILYAKRQGDVLAPAKASNAAIPHLRGAPPSKLAQVVAKSGRLKVTSGGQEFAFSVSKALAPAIAQIDGTRTLVMLQGATNLDPLAFNSAWAAFAKPMTGLGLINYSKGFLT